MRTTSRQGRRIDDRFLFSCASCGGVAATLQVIGDDREVDGGPLPGGARLRWRSGAPSYRLEFVAVTTGPAPDGLVEVLSGVNVIDPLALRRIDWELAAFCCVSCEVNYCPNCWTRWTEFDDGSFDCMRGRCPHGHEQMLSE